MIRFYCQIYTMYYKGACRLININTLLTNLTVSSIGEEQNLERWSDRNTGQVLFKLSN